MQIENRPAEDVIRLYDSPGTLFYCDPPYVHSTRGDSKAYRFEMDDAAHVRLANVVASCQGKVAMSGYRCDLLDTVYPAGDESTARRRIAIQSNRRGPKRSG